MNNKHTFYENAEWLDQIISLDQPNSEQVEKTLTLISEESLKQYFFRHITESNNLAWFPILREQGFFSSAPQPVEVDDGISYPHWPALSYLAAISPELPSEVVEVIKNFQLENAFGMTILVDSFTNISAEYAPQIKQIIIKWLDLGLYVNEELIELILHWTENEQWESALALIEVILTPLEEPVPDERRQSPYFSPRAKFRQYDYFIEQFLKLIVPELLKQHCRDFLNILENNIIQAFTIEHSLEQERKSSFWRSSIEPSTQNLGDHCKDLLLDATTRTTQEILDKHQEDAIPTINRFLNHPYSIFRRLSIHTIRTNPKLWPQYLDKLYSDPKYWDDISYYHEYWLLTQLTFSALPPKNQDTYLYSLIANLPNYEEGFEKKAFKKERYWIYRRLWAINNELSNTTAQPIFEELQKEFGDPDPPEWFAFLSYSSGVRSGWVSPKSSIELAQLSPGQVLAELKKPYQPSFASFDEPTREGLATELGRAIKDNPKHFTSIAPHLVNEDIFPLYVAHAVRGFRDAWKEKVDFDWEPIIEMSHKVSKTQEEQNPDGTHIDMNPNYWDDTYGSARSAVAELLKIAVLDDNNAVPYDFLEDVRDILLRLTNDVNPSPEYEEKWEGDGFNKYLNLALNVTRAKALEALILYSLHRARTSKHDKSTKDLLHSGTRLENLVRLKLTEKLNKTEDPSKAVHVNFGMYLPNLMYLDRDWVMDHLDDIFPVDPWNIEFFNAAWDGYLYRRDFFAGLYPNLKKYYNYAIDQLKKSDAIESGFSDSTSRLAAHLALLYIHGEESINGKDSLLVKFLDLASDDQISWFVKMLSPDQSGISLTIDSDEWQRLKAFWRQRHDHIQSSDQLDKHFHELEAYIWWIPHIPEPLNPFYNMITTSASIADNFLLVKLFGYLTEKISDNLQFVVTLYEKVYQKSGSVHFWGADRNDVSTIMETAISSDDPIAQESAIRIINLYGERGDERYRYLLQEE